MSALPRGVWFEPARNRYRVRVYSGTAVVHRSYHASKADALAAHAAATEARLQPFQPPALDTALDRIALLQNRATPIPTEKLITIPEMVNIYFRAQPPAARTVWKWIRAKLLPANRIGRAYYMRPSDVERFVRSH